MNRIKSIRTELGIKQIDLAQRLNIRQNTLSNWETGKSEPDSAMLKKLAQELETTVDYLVGGPPPGKISGVRIPVLGDVAAGIPIEAVTDIVDYEEIDAALARTGEFFGLRIKGASMEPRMREGDVVIVRRQDTADTGDTVVVLVNGDSATVKKIKYGPDGITLLPTNPTFDPIFYSAAEVEQLPVRVIGRVVEPELARLHFEPAAQINCKRRTH